MGAETVLLECPRSAASELRDADSSVPLFDWGKDAPQATAPTTMAESLFLGEKNSHAASDLHAHHAGHYSQYFDMEGKHGKTTQEATSPSGLMLFDLEAESCMVAEPHAVAIFGHAAEELTPVVEEGFNLDIELSRPLTPSTHVAVTTVHYPYSLDRPYNILDVCECPHCVHVIGQQIGVSAPLPTMSRLAAARAAPIKAMATTVAPRPSYLPPATSEVAAATAVTAPSLPPALVSSMAGRSIVATRRPYVTPFMPPPPPPAAGHAILAEEDPATATKQFRQMLLRWYAKLQRVQLLWTGAVEVCPSPPEAETEFALEQWSMMATCWWNAHFAHLQKRHKPYYYTRYH